MVLGDDSVSSVRRIGEYDIMFCAVLHGVDTSTSVEEILPFGTPEGVIAVSAIEDIVSVSTASGPPSVTIAVESVVSIPSSQDVVSCSVVSVIDVSDEEIVSGVSIDSVIA